MSGVTQAILNMSSLAHTYAAPAGSYDYLQSTATPTGCEILWRNTQATTLAVGINDSLTSIVVASTEGYLPGMVILIGTEEMYVSAIVGSNKFTVARGHNGTTAAAHSADATIHVASGKLWGMVRLCCAEAAETLPQVVHFFHDEACVEYGGTMRPRDLDSAQSYGHTVKQNPCADDDEFTHTFEIAAGTYYFTSLGITDADGGIVEWQIDGEIIGIQDWYSVSIARNVEKSIGPITLTAGRHVLKRHTNGKNPSSSDYCTHLTKSWLNACLAEVVSSGPPPWPPPDDEGGPCFDCTFTCLKLTVPAPDDLDDLGESQAIPGEYILLRDPEDPCFWVGGSPGFRAACNMIGGGTYADARMDGDSGSGLWRVHVGDNQYTATANCLDSPITLTFNSIGDDLGIPTVTLAKGNCNTCAWCDSVPDAWAFTIGGTAPCSLGADFQAMLDMPITMTRTGGCRWDSHATLIPIDNLYPTVAFVNPGVLYAFFWFTLEGGKPFFAVSFLNHQPVAGETPPSTPGFISATYYATPADSYDCQSCLTMTNYMAMCCGGAPLSSGPLGSGDTITLCPGIGEDCNDCTEIPEQYALPATGIGATAINPDYQFIFSTQLILNYTSDCIWDTTYLPDNAVGGYEQGDIFLEDLTVEDGERIRV